jgi:hypothetical protein
MDLKLIFASPTLLLSMFEDAHTNVKNTHHVSR